MKRLCQVCSLGLVILIATSLVLTFVPYRISADEAQGVDMVLVVDNSRSMFENLSPANQYDKTLGSDPDLLRIQGAAMFIAGLGAGESDPSKYQLGVVNLGATARALSSLTALLSTEDRDSLYAKIEHPQAEDATRILEALQTAHAELSKSRQSQNSKVIVLLTDGEPFPREGQSDAQLEEWVKGHSDVSLFIILLNNPLVNSPGSEMAVRFQDYIQFWNNLQKFSHVHTYSVKDKNDLLDYYNRILTQIAGGQAAPAKGKELKPREVQLVAINEFAEKLTVVAIRDDLVNGRIQIIDGNGQAVAHEGLGVFHFQGTRNPVEIWVITPPRLAPGTEPWKVESVGTALVRVFVDVKSSFRIKFLEPAVTETGVANEYDASGTFSPNKPLSVRLQVVDKNGDPLREKLILRAVVSREGYPSDALPEGAFSFDPQDYTYGVVYTFVSTAERPATGIYAFTIEAALANLTTSARLRVNLQLRPLIAAVQPQSAQMTLGQQLMASATVDDYNGALPASYLLEVVDLASGSKVVLQNLQVASGGQQATFTGDLAPLLGRVGSYGLEVYLHCRNAEGVAFEDEWREPILVTVEPPPSPTVPPTPTKTPTPRATPTSTPTPAPTPTPVLRVGTIAVYGPDIPKWIGLIVLLLLAILLGPTLLRHLITRILGMMGRLPEGWIAVVQTDQQRGAKTVEAPLELTAKARQIGRWKLTIGSKGHIRLDDDGSGKIRPVVLEIWRSGEETRIGRSKTDYKVLDKYQRDWLIGTYTITFSTETIKLVRR